MTGEQPKIGLSQDAAIVLALAETAIPFAATREDEAERWVRVLRMHGQVGGVLQGMGVGEAPLETLADVPSTRTPRHLDDNVVHDVAQTAARYAIGRGALLIVPAAVRFAILEVYDKASAPAPSARGPGRDELIELLAAPAAPPT